MPKKWIILLVAIVLTAITFGTYSVATAAGTEPGSSPDNPIVVSSLDQIPAEAALTAVKNDDCSTTTTGVLTVPGNEETSHQEFRFLREVPAVDEVSHTEYLYQREVVDYKTQYHFRKFTHTKERTYTEGTPAGPNLWWNWSPNNTHGPQNYTPAFPSDARGTWQGPHENGGPMQSTFGTFQTGGGNSPFFHREHGTPAVAGSWSEWGPYGPWTAWVPETHTSWQDSDAPLGSPEFHGQGQNGNVQWYREWQAQADGQTRQVENGSHTETSEWLTSPPEGDGWVQVDNRQVVDSEEIPGYTEYYVMGGEPSLNEADASWILAEQAPEGWVQFDERTVSNEDGTDPVTTYYSYNDGVTCDKPHNPPHQNPPVVHHNPPTVVVTNNVPTLIDAGL